MSKRLVEKQEVVKLLHIAAQAKAEADRALVLAEAEVALEIAAQAKAEADAALALYMIAEARIQARAYYRPERSDRKEDADAFDSIVYEGVNMVFLRLSEY